MSDHFFEQTIDSGSEEFGIAIFRGEDWVGDDYFPPGSATRLDRNWKDRSSRADRKSGGERGRRSKSAEKRRPESRTAGALIDENSNHAAFAKKTHTLQQIVIPIEECGA